MSSTAPNELVCDTGGDVNQVARAAPADGAADTALAATAPAFHRGEDSPGSLVRGRYLLNEFVGPFTKVVYGTDVQSRVPPNKKITFLLYDNVDEFNR